jgi:hypothetical protein
MGGFNGRLSQIFALATPGVFHPGVIQGVPFYFSLSDQAQEMRKHSLDTF